MNLPVPVVGSESGPQYATDINSCMTVIDGHTHASGSGTQITPLGLNINTNLTLNSNFLINVAGVTLVAQGSQPANKTVYVSGLDLYYTDGVGNNVRITQSGGVAGSPGSISNLTAPASAAYVAGSSTFVWQSNTGIAANMDFGSAVLRNITPNSTFGITLQAPAALSSNYSVILPALPVSQSFMTIDNSGNMAGYASISGGIVNSNIANATITGSKIAAATIAGSNIISNTITGTQIANNIALPGQGAALNGQTLVVANTNPASNGLAVLRATFNNAGALVRGEGASATSFGSGLYTVTFNNPFADTPVVVVNTTDNNFFVGVVPATSTNGCTIQFYNTVTGGGNNAGFNLIAIGKT